MKWARPEAARFEAWLVRVRESIIEVNDGIVAAAGVAEGFASVGASSHTVLLAGTSVTLAGGLAAAGVRYTEARTEWEMNRAQIDAERASILADPEGELAELAGIYEAKGLDAQLARQVARALTDRDPVAAHTDAELRLDALGPTSGALPAAATAGLSYGAGALLPLIAMYLLPLGERMPITFLIVLVALGLTGWFAAWLTDLPAVRLIRRNVLLGAATMVIGILIGKAVGL
ncbi:MAG TPA: VIT1/CCC1 transporter family protein [Mycobacteriales bacterium]|nr:VIT1/CCC1 transporter family protein [Mycobacteriales bacterium]